MGSFINENLTNVDIPSLLSFREEKMHAEFYFGVSVPASMS